MFLKVFILSLLPLSVFAEYQPLTADWSENATIPAGTNRANIFNLDAKKLEEMKANGYKHAMKYPVSITGLLIPYQAFLRFFKSDEAKPVLKQILQVTKSAMPFLNHKSEKELFEWLGVNPVNDESTTGIYKMPYPSGQRDQFYAGSGLIKDKNGAEGLTFSCFTCHTANLFGTTVMGLTNKRPRPYKFYHHAQKIIPHIPTSLFKAVTKASDAEVAMFNRTKKNLRSVGAKVPQVLGLDTSLPQMALSLARRNDDEFATKSKEFEANPRYNELETFVSDSKPLPWWNLKYKTRFLADGSVSGNPVFTNFTWNEIGRGTDLKELEQWMKDNRKTIDEVTVAAFATEAPRYTDFFSVKSIDLNRAKAGEKIFKNSCQKCHGEYQKAWNAPDASSLSEIDVLATTKVIYHDKTPNKDVGTDPQRSEGMKYFADALNNLAISKYIETTVTPQKGYIPPPLVGIWARYPYLHNNSIPNLCALLTRPEDRPTMFVQGPAENKETDYDQDCVGYPVGDKIPKAWLKDKEAIYRVGGPGLSNQGHSKMFIGKNGEELLTPADKKNLIHFLKTL
jgi:mono/diheme cytochrome c family protein